MDELSSDEDSDDQSEEEVEDDEEEMEGGKDALVKKRDEDDEDANSDTVESEDDDDDDENDEDDEATKAEISNLQAVLAESPFHYDSHVALIKACRKIGDLTTLRSAREKMATSFPLTPELWKEWIADERRIIDEGDISAEKGSSSSRDAISALFERAVVDYLSVDLWTEFCAFAIGAGDADMTRAVFDRALDAVRLHVSRGREIWESYREFEVLTLGMLMKSIGNVEEGFPPEVSQKIEAQTGRVTKLFERQLMTPHSQMDETMAEYEEWLRGAGEVSDKIKKGFIEAKKRLAQLQKLEDELEETENKGNEGETSAGAVYKKYIDYELSQDSPGRIQLIYERAITSNPLDTEMWLQFDYMDRRLKCSADQSIALYRRAVRNCSWSAELWRRLLVSLERGDQTKAVVDDAYVKSLSAGFSTPAEYGVVIGAYLDYMRRRCGKIEKDAAGKAVENDKLRLFRGAFDQVTSAASHVL